MLRYAVLCFLLLAGTAFFNSSRGQDQNLMDFRIFDSVPVKRAQDTLLSAWTGGLNNPQFSTIDLNNDGKKDLFVFDRATSAVRTFLNTGGNFQSEYKYAPQYEHYFPEDLSGWVLLRDYDLDGKEDIFTLHPFGVRVFDNIGDTLPAFAPNCTFEHFGSFGNCYGTMKFGTDFFNIEIPKGDIPVVDDIDGDDKLDILSFGNESSTQRNRVVYYHNISPIQDSLVFELKTKCWGVYSENDTTITPILNNYAGCPDSGGTDRVQVSLPDKKRGAARHAGSTLVSFDWEGDGDKDLLVGDISFPEMVLLINGGDSNKAHITSSIANFPTARPIDTEIFPGAFYEDVNNDGQKDLLIAPNAVSKDAKDYNHVAYYRNNRSTSNPVFGYVDSDFLEQDMVDLGTGAYPVILDINGDSLPDLLVGNEGYYRFGTRNVSGLAILLNEGTYNDSVTYPVFTLADTNYLGLIGDSTWALKPAVGDLDADGDQDLILGDAQGKMRYYENQAIAPGDSVVFVRSAGWDTTLSVTAHATPTLYDLDKDGDLDLVVGDQYGEVTMFLNQGDSSSPVYNNTFKTAIGGIDITNNFGDGFTVPQFVELDTNYRLAIDDTIPDHTYLFLGTVDGDVIVYDSIDNNTFGSFRGVDTISLSKNRVAPTIGDIFLDGNPELTFGQYSGGMGLMLRGRGLITPPEPPIDTTDTIVNPPDTTDTTDTTGIFFHSIETNTYVYPNPMRNELNVLSPFEGITRLTLTDLRGRRLKDIEFGLTDNVRELHLDISSLENQPLLLHLRYIDERTEQFKLIKGP